MKCPLQKLVALIALALSPVASAGVSAEKVALRVVPRQAFCASLTGTLGQYAELNGYDQVQSALLVSAGVAAIVTEAKAGRAQPYVRADALAALANVPNRAPEGGTVPLSALLGPALGMRPDATVAVSAGELRFLPFAQRGLDVIVLARDVTDLTEERAMKVAETARTLGIRVSSVWLDSRGGPDGVAADGDARILAWLAAATGGTFADLGGRGNPCAPRL